MAHTSRAAEDRQGYGSNSRRSLANWNREPANCSAYAAIAPVVENYSPDERLVQHAGQVPHLGLPAREWNSWSAC
jgi:hypothetical protein